MIDKSIKDAIRNGIRCKLCGEGHLTIIRPEVSLFTKPPLILPPPKIVCDYCHHGFIIRYKERPFEIVDIVEDK